MTILLSNSVRFFSTLELIRALNGFTETLMTEATNLEFSINQLHPADPLEADEHSLVLSVFSSCLPVIRARISNLSMAQELVQSSKENIALGLQMESLGL
jgi:hypothetical protein